MIMSLSRRVAFLMLLLFINTLISLHARAEQTTPGQTIDALGTAVIVGKDVAKAREQAIDNALTASVARIVAEYLSEETLIANFKELNTNVFKNADQYVDNYKVMTEALGGKLYRVMVQAAVSAPKIHQQLAALNLLNQPANLPRVMIFLAESQPDEPSTPNVNPPEIQVNDQFVRELIAKAISAQNMEVIGPEQSAQATASQDSPSKDILTDAAAVQMGKQMQADVVIVGVFNTLLAPNTMGTDVRSFKGSVNLRALRTDSGVTIASFEQTSVTVSDDAKAGCKNALTNAVDLAGKRLAAEIVSAWAENSPQTETEPTRIVEVIVEGTGSLSNFVMFRRVLSELPGVKEIQIKEMKTDEAKIMVQFQGDGRKLADSLMTKSYENFGIDIFEVLPEKIKVELIPG